MMRWARKLWHDHRAAVAPTVALSLFALIGAGGLAFDYAHMATLDTELQDAADQAALAAATQLDGQSGAVTRATAAAQALLTNSTLMSNDGNASGSAVTIPVVVFYTTKSNAENNISGFTDTTRFAEAHFVRVAVLARRANFALTPIVGVLTSGDIPAEAVAGLGSAICKTPPVMICNPAEPSANSDESYGFDSNALKGYGLRLVTGDASAPGNFGFLQTNFGSGASDLASALGYNSPPGDCSATDLVETKTGMNSVVMNALNTRFDVDTNGANTCPSGGTCSPSRNSRKDLVKGGNASQNCGITGNGWQVSATPYLPAPGAAPSHTLVTTGYPDIMGHPRDICHAVSLNGDCKYGGNTATRIGDGVWDRNAYFRVNYGWTSQATWTAQTRLPANATRYEVYQWELDHTTTADMTQSTGGSKKGYSFPVCLAPGITPNATTVDRRRISAAVLNCNAVNLHGGAGSHPVLKWIDLFLVEPSYDRGSGGSKRTESKDVYAEIIGETSSGVAGQTAGQVVRRDVPYLIK